jgi:hypothetical protein
MPGDLRPRRVLHDVTQDAAQRTDASWLTDHLRVQPDRHQLRQSVAFSKDGYVQNPDLGIAIVVDRGATSRSASQGEA